MRRGPLAAEAMTDDERQRGAFMLALAEALCLLPACCPDQTTTQWQVRLAAWADVLEELRLALLAGVTLVGWTYGDPLYLALAPLAGFALPHDWEETFAPPASAWLQRLDAQTQIIRREVEARWPPVSSVGAG